MGKSHDVDFINARGFLIPCARPGFVYTTILCWLSVFFTVPTQNDGLLNNECLVKRVPLATGPHCPLHPVPEAPTATAAQNRGHTALHHHELPPSYYNALFLTV